MSKDNITDIAVIGGGASGFAAAIEAKTALPKARVVILEKLDRVGRKILATGNGRCNLSNINLSADHYHGSVKNVMRIIGATPSAKEFFGSIGVICTADTKGRIYPKSNSAATVLSALRLRAEELYISERCNFEATFIESTNDGFRIHSASGEKFPCRRVIVAAGGYAAPQFGTDGSVIRLLRSKGCHTTKICPAVAPLRVRPELLKGLKGVRAKGRVMAYSAGRLLKEEVGEIQFTENALSGICVFNTPGANANAVKELVVLGLLLSGRDVVSGIQWAGTLKGQGEAVGKLVEKGKSQFVGPELQGKTLGVIGLGGIGGMVANIAVSLGMKVLGLDPYISVDNAWRLKREIEHVTKLNDLLAKSDFVTLHIPLTKDTKGSFSAEQFAAMKDGAALLNFSRGEIVDTPALLDASRRFHSGKRKQLRHDGCSGDQ